MDDGIYDDWQWHLDGAFPHDRDPEQAYVHIGVFTAWLARHDLLVVGPIHGESTGELSGLRDRTVPPSAFREATHGRLTADMLSPDGRTFTSAYYAPEYGYARDWQRVFGRQADTYAVPDTWDSYARMEPILDERYAEWVQAGKPELMRLPGLLGRLARLLDRRA